MNAKELLNRVKEIKKEIEIKSRLAMAYRDIATGLQSPQYTDMPKNPNRKLQPMADALDKAMEFEEEIEQILEEYGICYERSETWIPSEKLYEVLYTFYLEVK